MYITEPNELTLVIHLYISEKLFCWFARHEEGEVDLKLNSSIISKLENNEPEFRFQLDLYISES
jgi:hypothetical protein